MLDAQSSALLFDAGNHHIAQLVDVLLHGVLGLNPIVDTMLAGEQLADLGGAGDVGVHAQDGINKWVEAKYTVEKDIDKMGDMMIARIEEKRAALGI